MYEEPGTSRLRFTAAVNLPHAQQVTSHSSKSAQWNFLPSQDAVAKINQFTKERRLTPETNLMYLDEQ
jgi:hypothetical protein